MYVYVNYGRYVETEKNTIYVASDLNSLMTPCFMRSDTKRHTAFFTWAVGDITSKFINLHVKKFVRYGVGVKYFSAVYKPNVVWLMTFKCFITK